jgi:hypothetical protein
MTLALAKVCYPNGGFRFPPFLHSSATVRFGFAEAIPSSHPESIHEICTSISILRSFGV